MNAGGDRASAPVVCGLRTVGGLFAGVVCLTAAVGIVTAPLVADPLVRALFGVALLTVVAVLVRPWFGSWRDLGMHRQVRQPWLLATPAVIAGAPLLWGVQWPPAAAFGILAAGYLLTGFTEELLWRGMSLRALERSRPLVAVLVTSALFGLSHLVNLLYRDNAGLVLAQVWGAFCFGVGYAALRRRIGSILPLMLLHAVTDFAGRITAGPAILFFVMQDAVLLGFGLVLVLRERGVPSSAQLVG